MNLAEHISGLQVLPREAVQHVPRLLVSPSFPWCTPEFRVEYNAWLRERFGTYEMVLLVNYADCVLIDPQYARDMFFHLHVVGFTL